MGAFYTHAICSFDDIEVIEKYISDNNRNAYLLREENNSRHVAITEELSDSQDIRENNLFYRPLSKLTKIPLLGCIVHDSDYLMLCMFSNGKDTYQLYDCPPWSESDRIKVVNLKALTDTYGGNVEKASEIHAAKNARKHVFAEEFQGEIYAATGLPLWAIGVGYNYLAAESELKEALRDKGVVVKKV